MTCTQLPFDVWECVAACIPEHELRELYGVNSALHWCALNAKYGRVEFKDFDDNKMGVLKRLQDPYIACRVHTLAVSSYAVFTSHHHRQSTTIYTPDEIIHAMTLALAQMHNVRHFDVAWSPHLFSHDLVPFFSAAWKRLGPTLTHLRLAAGSGVRVLLSLAAPYGVFPNLVELDIGVGVNDIAFMSRLRDVMKAAKVGDACPSVVSLMPRLSRLVVNAPGVFDKHTETFEEEDEGVRVLCALLCVRTGM
ncbi:hypothetical protein CYLTODRAFT_458114 [Cylindrobasidium torrendii FP15055 ss-10]|uniref:F-box domain-containing protein n=1 Tax=Cylindrobasidium torrendii FP15055 ss-10 TaxID=1314674 RepID=A0A0D7B1P9_9AGAR|nr:hypothetical protein CYLTODRAFT_458114 [Cylindrobasidium torrendii FP15055 ss-10]